MGKFKPVSISKVGFAFCRTVIAALVVLSAVPRLHGLLWAVFAIMAASAILRVRKAPLILLYEHTIGKIWPCETVIVDENGIFFSHIVGAVFSLLCLALYRINGIAGIVSTVLFAALQISAACGFCSALKLYTCMVGGNCCRFGKMVKKAGDKKHA